MQRFTIRDIEHLSGIKAHTLRIWEQRYSFFTSKRKESKHRYYDNEDLKQLLRISFLYHLGWKVSKIESLSPEGITEEVRKIGIDGGYHPGAVLKLLEAAIDFDHGTFRKILDELTHQIGFEETITKVCYPYLQRVGLLWVTSNIIPAQEHFSSYMIQHRIIAETEILPPPPDKAPLVFLFTPDGEYHELPLVFINYLFRKAGWKTVYLGINVQWSTLHQVVDRKEGYLFLHVITNFTGFTIDDYLENLCRRFPDRKILGSGAALQSQQRSFINFYPLLNDHSIYRFIREKFIPSEIHSF